MSGKRPRIESAILIGLTISTLGIALALPWLLNSNYYLQLFALAGINVILALGLNIVLGFTGPARARACGFVRRRSLCVRAAGHADQHVVLARLAGERRY